MASLVVGQDDGGRESGDEEIIASVASAGAPDVDAAVAAARAALDGPWGKMSARERGRLVSRLADRLMEKADEVARLETIHNGKPITESRQIEIPAAANVSSITRAGPTR